MIATSTKFLDTLLEGKNLENNLSEINLDKNETLFYDLIKPVLNNFLKQPQQETVSKILAYSKSLKLV